MGVLPIHSTREQVVTRYVEDSEVLMHEATRLSIPCGSLFYVRLQYYAAARTTQTCRLCVTYELVFTARANLMKPLLSHMLLSEHRAVFAAWTPFLVAAVQNGGGAPHESYSSLDPAAESPDLHAARGGLQLLTTAILALCTAVATCTLLCAAGIGALAVLLDCLSGVPWARRLAHSAEASAAGTHPEAGELLTALGHAVKAARFSLLPLTIAIACLFSAALLGILTVQRMLRRNKANIRQPPVILNSTR